LTKKHLPITLVTCVLILLGGIVQPASAEEPVKRQEFVWSVTTFSGQWYLGTFSPPEVPTIYLLAGTTNVVAGRYTMVYYWPIDREYKPDWATLNQDVEGTLELLDRSGNLLQQLRLGYFLATNPQRDLGRRTVLLLGQDAVQAYSDYRADLDAYRAASAEYDRQYREYLVARAARPDDPSVEPPAALPTFNQALAPPKQGFALALQPGVYQILMRDSMGEVIPGSRRTVISVAPRRQSVGYTVIPEEKWTIPEVSNERSQAIYYTARGTAVYLQPYRTLEYNEQQYVRITEPQDTAASANRWLWIQTAPLQEVELQVVAEGQVMDRIPRGWYVVEQVPGAALGYRVIPFSNAVHSAPTFEAFEVLASSEVAGYRVRLVGADGGIVPGSERSLIKVSDDLSYPAYLLAVLPLMVAAAVQSRRRRLRARTLRVLEQSQS
jgi:hypothetical protein